VIYGKRREVLAKNKKKAYLKIGKSQIPCIISLELILGMKGQRFAKDRFFPYL